MASIDITSQCTFTPANNTVMARNNNFTVVWNNSEYSVNYPITVYDRSVFNKPYKISHWNCDNLFNLCSMFNQPVDIPNYVNDCRNMFNGCSNFNQKVGDLVDVDTTETMFGRCTKFNQPVNLIYEKNNILTGSFSGMFIGCSNFNSPIKVICNAESKALPGSFSSMFSGCSNFNQSVDSIFNNFTNKLINASYYSGSVFTGMFKGCSNFNQPVTFPDILIEDGYISDGYYYTFENCTKLNSPIKIGNGVTELRRTFRNCKLFNAPVTIGKDVNAMMSTFYDCYWFNRPITLPPNIEELNYCFYNCLDFNQELSIPGTVISTNNTFRNCLNLNKKITIDCTSLAEVQSMFRNCVSLNTSPVFINAENGLMEADPDYMFANCRSLTNAIHFDLAMLKPVYFRTFEGCTNLLAVTIECNNTYYRDKYITMDFRDMFFNCYGDRNSYLHVWINANNVGVLDLEFNSMFNGWPSSPRTGAGIQVIVNSYDLALKGSSLLTYIVNKDTPLTYNVTNGTSVTSNFDGWGVSRRRRWERYANTSYNIIVNLVWTEDA